MGVYRGTMVNMEFGSLWYHVGPISYLFNGYIPSIPLLPNTINIC